MYELLGISLALATLLSFNAVASFVTSALWRLLQVRAKNWSAQTQAQALFALRIFPGLVAVVCVVALLLPAYLAHEPRHKAEEVSWKLGALALLSAAGLLLAVWRGIAAWKATRNLTADWLSNSEPVALEQASVPAFRLNHSFPVIAVVGWIRPRLFIAGQLFDSLTPQELSAAIAHECGHLSARDNLKRTLLRICRDVLTIVPCGRSLDREWVAVSEVAADDFAARKGGAVALDLASALVKIARMIPDGQRPAMPASVSLLGEDIGSINQRVRRLTRRIGLCQEPSATESLISTSLWLPFGATLAAAVAIAAESSLLSSVHHLIEIAVSTLR